MIDEENIDENLIIDKPIIEKWRRDYSLNEIPRNSFGNPLYREDTEKNFLVYVEWLANYLYNAPPLSPKMQTMSEENLGSDKTSGHQILILAYDANIYDLEISFGDDEFQSPGSIDKTQVSPELLEKAKSECEQKRKLGLAGDIGVPYSDISWRVPLAWILNKVPDKKERIELLKSYFEEYDCLNYK